MKVVVIGATGTIGKNDGDGQFSGDGGGRFYQASQF